VDESLGIDRAAGAVEPVAVEIELDDVVLGDKAGAPRARQEITSGILWMANADVAEGVDHALVAEDAVRHHEIADRRRHALIHDSALPMQLGE